MDKPSAPYKKVSTSVPSPIPNQIPDPSIRASAFKQLVEQRGIRFIHRKAAPCPNMTSIDANNHDPDCKICGGNGFLFYTEKEIVGTFISNSLQKNYEAQGIWEIGSAMVSMPYEYEDGTQAEFQQFDQLIIPDFTIRLWQLKHYENTPDGTQQLRYPIQKSDYFAYVDDSGNMVELVEGTDFSVIDGKIKWLKSLPYNASEDLGVVFTANYFAHPVYIVQQHARELRITQEMDAAGNKIAKRMNQQLIVKRDFLANKSGTPENQ